MLDLHLIRIDGGTQSRAKLNNDLVAEYVDAYKAGAKFPAVTVFYDGKDRWLADGFHRYHAAKQAGKKTILENVIPGTLRDAKFCSWKANQEHGQRRSNEDKRNIVLEVLADEEAGKWSDTHIAKEFGFSPTFVGNLRKSLSTVDSEKPAERTYTTKQGTTATMQTANIGKPQKPLAAKSVPAVNDADGAPDDSMLTDDDLLQQMQETQEENLQLQERVELMAKDDKAAEIDKLLIRIAGLDSRIKQQAMQIKTSSDGEKYHAAVIHKLRKLLGVDSHKEIIDAVTGLIAERRRAA